MSNIRDLVLTADRELFTEHDLSSLDRYFSEDYVEHSPLVENGKDGLREMVAGAGAVSYTHLTLPTISCRCRSRWSPYH